MFRSGYSESLPPGSVLGGVIDAIWPRPSGHRLAIIVGNGTSPDYWEVEEVHNGRSPEQWSEQDPVRLFLPQTSIHVMCQEAKAVSASHELNNDQKRNDADKQLKQNELQEWPPTSFTGEAKPEDSFTTHLTPRDSGFQPFG